MNSVTDKIQEHRGADAGIRSTTSEIRRDSEKATRVRYGWTLDHGPISSTPSRKHWQSDKRILKLRGFLNTNYIWIEDRKVRVL